MSIKEAIVMLDEYLEEPNSIQKEWREALIMCRAALLEAEARRETEKGAK